MLTLPLDMIHQKECLFNVLSLSVQANVFKEYSLFLKDLSLLQISLHGSILQRKDLPILLNLTMKIGLAAKRLEIIIDNFGSLLDSSRLKMKPKLNWITSDLPNTYSYCQQPWKIHNKKRKMMSTQLRLTFSELKEELKNRNPVSHGTIAIETKEKANVKHLLPIILKERRSQSTLPILVQKRFRRLTLSNSFQKLTLYLKNHQLVLPLSLHSVFVMPNTKRLLK